MSEGRAASSLSYPDVAVVHDVGEVAEQSFIAMELVEGVSLDERRRADRFGVEEVRPLGGQPLDHHLPTERGLLGHEDPAHAAPAELLLECVGASERGLQLLAELLGHVGSEESA